MGYKFTPALCLLGSALLMAAPAAMAQSVFVIQLGSFPSKQEAEQKWESLKKSQPEVMGGLSMQVSEAILQPDNITLFRTQAGPFRNKIDAQTACSKLKGKSECFVVETAMFAPASSTQMASLPASLPTPGDNKPAGLAPLPLPPELPATTVKTVTSSETKTGTSVEKMPETKPMPAEEKSGSGWFSWMHNPFSSKDEEKKMEMAKPATPVMPASSTISAAPVSSVQQAPLQPTPATLASRPGQTVFYAAADEKPQDTKPWTPSTRIEPSSTSAPATMPIASNSTSSAPPLLKPAPLPPVMPPVMAAMPAPVAPPPPVASALPAADFPITAGAKPITIRARTATAAAEPVIAPAPVVKAVPAGDAKVKVAEAIRVPLTSRKRLISSANPASFRGMPSQNLGLRSYWAQLSFFPDERNALDFWQSFSSSMPEFYNVRVRVVKPYLTRGRSARASLRVGPFEDTASIEKLCRLASSRGLRCTTVADLGSSTVANAPRNREAVPLKYQTSREENVSGNWVQLGTYRSAHEAEAMWDELKDAHSDLLKKVESKVSTPALSSSPQAKYRLRAGPFASPVSAANLCRQLKFRNVNCVTVSGN